MVPIPHITALEPDRAFARLLRQNLQEEIVDQLLHAEALNSGRQSFSQYLNADVRSATSSPNASSATRRRFVERP